MRRRSILKPPRSRRGDRLWLFVLFIALVGWWAYHNWWPKPSQVYIAPGGLELYLIPGQGHQAKTRLIGLINSAEGQVEVAALELEDREIGQALRSAAARGVRVRMLNDSDYRRETRESLGVNSNSKARCETLNRVEVCYDSRDNALMHHKFVLVDNKGVWTGSTNLTWNAFLRNNENSLFLPVQGLVDTYRAEFEAIFGGQEQGLGQSQQFVIGNTRGEVFFSPAGGRAARGALLDVINRASNEILLASYVLTDSKIVEALTRAHRRGVKVRAVIDARNLENSKDETLGRAGIEVRKDGNPYTMHDKVMVIDQTWVVTGSYNFTSSGYSRNNENLLILQDPALAGRYHKEVEAIWRKGTRL